MPQPEFSKAVIFIPQPGEKQSKENKKNVPLKTATTWIAKHPGIAMMGWKVSEISVKLGLPVKVCQLPEGSGGTGGPADPPYNNAIEPLLLISDPNHSDFGALCAAQKTLEGESIIMRCDGEDLETLHVWALVQYINEVFGIAATSDWDALSKEAQESFKVEIGKKLNPVAFAA